jgi:hypothetical protein
LSTPTTGEKFLLFAIATEKNKKEKQNKIDKSVEKRQG